MSTNEVRADTKQVEGPTEENTDAQVEKILAGFKGEKSEVIPILQQVQQALGYLPQPVMKRIAGFVKVPECTLFGVATFYAQFKLVPTGKNIVRVCRGTACHVRGGARILKDVEKRLGIKPGESTPDMEYALETGACIGACALAPNMVVNDKIYGNLNSKKIASILDAYKEK